MKQKRSPAVSPAHDRLVGELSELREENARLREYALMDANCPCCGTTDVCEEGCTFADDCPNEYPRMEAARAALDKARQP